MRRWYCALAALGFAVCAAAQGAPQPHVVFLVGEDEYESGHTMPLIAGALATQHGMRTTILHDTNPASVWEPKPGDRLNRFEDVSAIADANLLVLYLRFRTLPDDQLAAVQAHIDAGKPIVAFRTSTHAFNYHPEDPLAAWNDFGATVLGAPWIRHYGHESSTDVAIAPGAAQHPILRGVAKTFHVRSWLYHIRPDYPPPGATVLLEGTSVGAGTVPAEAREPNPVAWTWTHPGGGRVFTTTLGHQEDFEVAGVRRLVINGIHWALDRPIPADAAVQQPEAFALRSGDRVVFVGNTFFERDVHHSYFETALASRFPGERIVFRNLGWSGDTVYRQMRPLNFGTVAEHVQLQEPTHLFVCFGMNEAFDGPGRIPEFTAAYEALLDSFADTGAQTVLVSPIPHINLGPPLPDPAAHNDSLAQYTAAIAQLAADRDLGFVNLFDAIKTAPNPAALTDNGIHLNAAGYAYAARAVEAALGVDEPRRWELDAQVQFSEVNPVMRVAADGLAIQTWESTPTGLRFTARGDRLPLAQPDAATPYARVQVAGLLPGRYALQAGGETLASGTADAWANGVALDSGPDWAQAHALREAAADKAQLFFFRWRAHNGEYIYGRRARTGGGNAGNPQFESEHAEFERLIAEKERQIAALSRPVVHEYELVRLGD